MQERKLNQNTTNINVTCLNSNGKKGRQQSCDYKKLLLWSFRVWKFGFDAYFLKYTQKGEPTGRKATAEEIINFYKGIKNQLKMATTKPTASKRRVPPTRTPKVALGVPQGKKIIGYKSPTPLFEGNYSKDIIWALSDVGSKKLYKPNDGEAVFYAMPAEIVETWEPVYEEEGFKKGDFVVIESTNNLDLPPGQFHLHGIYQLRDNYSPKEQQFNVVLDDGNSINNGYTGQMWDTIKVRAATPAEIETAQDIIISGYTAKFADDKSAVNFGCQVWTKAEVDALSTIFDKGTLYQFTIDGNIITRSLVKKIQRRLS